MIAVDASLIIEVLVGGRSGDAAADRLSATGEALIAPEILDLEVLQVLRRLAGAGRIAIADAEAGVLILDDLNITRFSHAPLRARIWALRYNLTAYDAAYFALAEALGVPLWTRDAKYLCVPGHEAVVALI